jgi:hypothetical protein
VLVITDDMRSEIDKKKEFKSLLFLTADKNTVYIQVMVKMNQWKRYLHVKKDGKWKMGSFTIKHYQY